jgi:ribosome maturation factor RimP
VSRELSPALDVAELITGRYNLEVGSPGVERTLRTASEFERFAGTKAKLKLHESVAGQKLLVGTLGPLQNEVLQVIEGKRTFEVALSNIDKANLVFEYGPAPKPGKSPAKKGPKS